MITKLPSVSRIRRDAEGRLHPTPFLRWAGGKRRLTHALIETFPLEFDPLRHRFFEPFVGGGALAFALGNTDSESFVLGKNLTISDMNPELINAYKVVRDSVFDLIEDLIILERKIDENNYYRIRADIPEDDTARAARFIYLNKTCYNGLWRVNRDGLFNVPFDKKKTGNASLFSHENLIACSERLKGSTIRHCGFRSAVSKANRGDMVYFDPPYIPLTPTASFSSYSKEGFGIEDHEELASVIRDLTRRGVYVLFSNSDTPLTRKIFRDELTLRRLFMRRSMSAKGDKRDDVYEILGMNYRHLQGTLMGQLQLVSRPKIKNRTL
jgi:DNA adenine methylase